MISRRGVHAAVWHNVATGGLMEASGLQVRRFIGDGDMLMVGENLVPYDSRFMEVRPSKVGFTEIR